MRNLGRTLIGACLIWTAIVLFPYEPTPAPPAPPEAIHVYLVFDGNRLAPLGGYVGSFPSIQEATSYMNKTCGGGSAHIIEVDTSAKPENAVAFKFNYQRIPSGEYLFSGREVRKDGLWLRD